MSETETKTVTRRVLKLGSTTVKGSTRKAIQSGLEFKNYTDPSDNWYFEPTVHTIAGPYGKVYRVEKDTILMPDGSGESYYLFSISKLQNLLKEAKKLAIVNKVDISS